MQANQTNVRKQAKYVDKEQMFYYNIFRTYVRKRGVETMSIRIKSKVRFIISFTVFLLMIIVSFSFFLLKGKAQEAPTYYLDWYVTKGDTLWSIAEQSLPEGRDIREYINEIRNWNKLSSSNIKEGQVLEIPIYESFYKD